MNDIENQEYEEEEFESKYTPKMEIMFEDVFLALFHCFPQEHIEFLFSPPMIIHPAWYVEYVLLEFIKYAYYETVEKYPLRHFIPYSSTDGDHSERMRYARTMKYTQKFRDINYQQLSEKVGMDSEEKKKIEVLLKKDMSDIHNRLEGYELSEMEFFEYTNIQELRIIKAIVENRISSVKKVSNDCFLDLFEEYDSWVMKLIERSRKSNEDMVFASIAFFTLEWKYSLELIYLIAEYMEDNKIENVDYYTLWGLTGFIELDSRFGYRISHESRMVKERQIVIEDLITEGEPDSMVLFLREKYVEIAVSLTGIFQDMTSKKGSLYKDWFKDNTTMEDWASFFEDYDVFSCWHKKKWTNKRIRNARKLLEMISPFGKIPDFRA